MKNRFFGAMTTSFAWYCAILKNMSQVACCRGELKIGS